MANEVRELRVQTVSKCTKDGSMYLAILQECEGKRVLPVLIDRTDAVHLLKKMKDAHVSSMPSSMEDVMFAMFLQSSWDIVEVRITIVQAGVTYCHILYKDHETYRMVRNCKAAVGLVLAYTFDAPITIKEELLEQQYMREMGDGVYSMPINSVNIEALEEALKRAIEDENYELASRLRDEIERRK